MEFKLTIGNCLVLPTLLLLVASLAPLSDGKIVQYGDASRSVKVAGTNKTLSFDVEKSGSFKDCGKEPFTITWSPDPISPSKRLDVYVDFKFPYAVTGGTYNITIWFHGDPEPFLGFEDSFTCDQIAKYFPCPIHKGFHLKARRTFEHIPNIGSYPGDYDVRVEIKNKDGKLIICLEGHVLILKN